MVEQGTENPRVGSSILSLGTIRVRRFAQETRNRCQYSHASLAHRAEVAQLVEQGTENPRVGSSILSLGTMLYSRLADILQAFFFGEGQEYSYIDISSFSDILRSHTVTVLNHKRIV